MKLPRRVKLPWGPASFIGQLGPVPARIGHPVVEEVFVSEDSSSVKHPFLELA
jgi:hypothetical protein